MRLQAAIWLILAVVVPMAVKAGPIVYGVESANGTFGGGIFAIDTQTGDAAYVGATAAGSHTGQFSPNSLAHDQANNLLYYSSYTDGGSNYLFSYNTATSVTQQLGGIIGTNATAAFYGGAYYYIAQGGNDLMRVTFNGSGNIANIETLDIYYGPAEGWTFGDIAIRADGMLFGSGVRVGSTQAELFQVNISSGTPIYVDAQAMPIHYQLAFSGDTLYGLRTDTAGLYELDYLVGTQHLINYVHHGYYGLTINDMADGPLMAIPEPTTWGMALIGLLGALIFRRRNQAP